MTTAQEQRTTDGYALARNQQEYERLRAQARVWESATGRLLDEVGLASGDRCLDAGCGPGETMRLMAQRVGPSGRVTGVDIDAELGAQAEATLHDAGHRQCRFAALDITAQGPIPGAPFDLVYARILLYHLPERVAVLRRLWDAVAPRGRLLIQDYDLRRRRDGTDHIAGGGDRSWCGAQWAAVGLKTNCQWHPSRPAPTVNAPTQGADQMTISASQQITEAAVSWPGVTAGTGRRGEWSLKVGKREIGHLHGDHAAHFSFPKQVWTELREQGRITDHPVFPGRIGPAARRIENDADVRDVIELLRLNYDRLVAGTPVAEHAA